MKNIAKFFKNSSLSILGFSVIILIMLVGLIVIIGLAKISEKVMPYLMAISVWCLVIFVLLILPLSLIKPLRSILSIISYIFSFVFGIFTWSLALISLWFYWGFLSIFLILFLHAFVPAAMIVLLFKGQFSVILTLLIGLILTYGMRFYSLWLGSLQFKNQESKTDIIDISSSSINK